MIYDLTHVMEEGMPVYPGTEPPSFRVAFSVKKDGFQETSLDILSHVGTHLDCPSHLLENTNCTDTKDINSFIGKALVIDCSMYEDGEQIELDFFKGKLDAVEGVEFVVLYTGYSKLWGKADYFGEYPVPTLESSHYLASLGLKGIGTDAISIDAINAPAHALNNHIALLSKDMIIVENLTNLENLLNKTVELICLPLKIKGGDGSPVRAIARV